MNKYLIIGEKKQIDFEKKYEFWFSSFKILAFLDCILFLLRYPVGRTILFDMKEKTAKRIVRLF